MVKKIWQYVNRFHLIPERRGQTDGRTELLYQHRASVCWRAIKITSLYRKLSSRIFSPYKPSQCSTLVRKTVVRAIYTVNGRLGNSTPEGPKPLNRLRWNCTWLITSPTLPHMHNLVNAYFCSSFPLCPAYPKNAGLALSASKSVFWW